MPKDTWLTYFVPPVWGNQWGSASACHGTSAEQTSLCACRNDGYGWSCTVYGLLLVFSFVFLTTQYPQSPIQNIRNTAESIINQILNHVNKLKFIGL